MNPNKSLKNIGCFTLLIMAILLLGSCQKTQKVNTISGLAQGTTYHVKYWQNNSKPVDNHYLQQQINKELARIDYVMSNYRNDSIIEQFNSNKTVDTLLPLDDEIMSVLTIAAEVNQASNGCYDPTIKPLFQLWGFSRDVFSLPSQLQIVHTLNQIGFQDKLIRQAQGVIKKIPEVTIDLSAIGQGYSVARIAQILTQAGIVNYLVEIGGEMMVKGQKPDGEPWRVGLERPLLGGSQQMNEVIAVSGEPVAIMVSGTYRHFFEYEGKYYSHILDPRTGKPVTHNTVAVTVLMRDATKADAWSTALLCLGEKDGLSLANQVGIAAIFYTLDSNNQLRRVSSNLANTKQKNWQILSN